MTEKPMVVDARYVRVYSDRPNRVELDLTGGFEPYTMDVETAMDLERKIRAAIFEGWKSRKE